MKTLNEIQREIGKWSRKNFGDNKSKAMHLSRDNGRWILANGPIWDHRREPDQSGEPLLHCPLTLGSLASLMGIVEEYCEFIDAEEMEAQVDAIGDIGIYLFDYVEREGLRVADIIFAESKLNRTDPETLMTTDDSIIPEIPLARGIGRLYHATLKSHQGIRGFDNRSKYRQWQTEGIALILRGLAACARYNCDRSFHSIISDVWQKVCGRDWNANPQDAAEKTDTQTT